MKGLLGKVGRVLLIVIHDPEVRRTGKVFAIKVAVRLILAAGGSVELVNLLLKLAG